MPPCCSFDNSMYALSPAGALQWNYSTGGHVFSTPVVLSPSGSVVFGSDDGYLYVVTKEGT